LDFYVEKRNRVTYRKNPLTAGRRRWSNCREVLSRHHWAHSRRAAASLNMGIG